jgi:hypothetical protein
MKEIFDRKLRYVATVAVALILLLIPFHAFLTIFASQFVGHYTLLRLWKEVLLAVVVFAAAMACVYDHSLLERLRSARLWRTIVLFLELYALAAVVAVGREASMRTAAAYGFLTATRFLFFFMAVWILADKTNLLWRLRYKLLLGPAAVVVLFGLLQRFVLPYDVLKHVGYGPDTIRPYQTIDKKTSFFRIISTLRGANPLGAYIVIIISVLTARFFAGLRKIPTLVFIILAVVVLAATYSRSAWLGAFVGAGLIVASKLKHLFTLRLAVTAAVVGAIVLGGSLYVLRNNDFVQNTFFHTDEHSVAATSSNHDHASASMTGLSQVLHEPFGRGTGTAGPASVYNTGHEQRIAENYYLQVGQEVGWLGLGLFLAICAMVARRLYAFRADPLALGLLTSFIGLVIVNLLSHGWTDDTLAYLWWGFAGLVLGALEKEKQTDDTRDEKA